MTNLPNPPAPSGELLYESLVNQLPQCIFRKDTQGRFTFANQRFCSFINRPLNDIIGKTDFDLFPAALASKYRQDDLELMASGRTLNTTEPQLLQTNGSLRYVEVVKWPLHSKTGETLGIQCIFWDVTEHRNAQEKLLQLASAVEQSPSSILITDTHGKIEFVNPKFTQISGYSPAEVIGKTPGILKSGYTSDQEYRRLWQTISQGNEWKGVFQNRHKDGSTFWESATITPIRSRSGQITHYLGVKEDITERKSPDSIHLIVTDFMMPLMDGLTLSRTIQALSRRPVPIIVSSGGLFDQQGSIARQAFLDLGVHAILDKPYQLTSLLQAIDAALNPQLPKDPQ